MLEIRGVRAGYGKLQVLHGVELSIDRGEVVALLGHNGMGKTTLLRAIMGLIPLRDGEMTLDGEDVSRLPAHARARRGIGYVPQGRLLFPRLSVRDNLRAAAAGLRQGERRVDELLDAFPVVREKADSKAASLSGGQQQIVAIARALAGEPRLLLLDEPCEGIQPSIVAEILDILLTLREQSTISILLVEQQLEFAVALTERALVMRKGEIVREMPSAEVLSDSGMQLEFTGGAT